MILIGAGTHANSIIGIFKSHAGRINHLFDGYIDPGISSSRASAMSGPMCIPRMDEVPAKSSLVMGFLGLSCEALERRYNVYSKYVEEGHTFPAILHKSCVDHALNIGAGVQAFANTVLNTGAHITELCVINTGAIIEHDAYIDAGTHVAPGAIVLGKASIGKFCFIGAGAIVVQGTEVPDRTFIKAGTVWTGK